MKKDANGWRIAALLPVHVPGDFAVGDRLTSVNNHDVSSTTTKVDISRLDTNGGFFFSLFREGRGDWIQGYNPQVLSLPLHHPLVDPDAAEVDITIDLMRVRLMRATDGWIVDDVQRPFDTCSDLQVGDHIFSINQLQLDSRTSANELLLRVVQSDGNVDLNYGLQRRRKTAHVSVSRKFEIERKSEEVLLDACIDGSCSTVDWGKLGLTLDQRKAGWLITSVQSMGLGVQIQLNARLVAVNYLSVAPTATLNEISQLDADNQFSFALMNVDGSYTGGKIHVIR